MDRVADESIFEHYPIRIKGNGSAHNAITCVKWRVAQAIERNTPITVGIEDVERLLIQFKFAVEHMKVAVARRINELDIKNQERREAGIDSDDDDESDLEEIGYPTDYVYEFSKTESTLKTTLDTMISDKTPKITSNTINRAIQLISIYNLLRVTMSWTPYQPVIFTSLDEDEMTDETTIPGDGYKDEFIWLPKRAGRKGTYIPRLDSLTPHDMNSRRKLELEYALRLILMESKSMEDSYLYTTKDTEYYFGIIACIVVYIRNDFIYGDIDSIDADVFMRAQIILDGYSRFRLGIDDVIDVEAIRKYDESTKSNRQTSHTTFITSKPIERAIRTGDN